MEAARQIMRDTQQMRRNAAEFGVLLNTLRERAADWQPGQLTSTAFDQRYYEEHRAAGLDYGAFGPWQRDYARWLTDVYELRGRSMIDVGTACGAIAHGFTLAGVHATGIDVSEAMIEMGRVATGQYDPPRRPWPTPPTGFETRLEICDAANLHLFDAAQFDFMHSHQSAEHWPPELVPRILNELHRVARPGVRFFCVLDTCELARRTGRDLESEDPTHVCIRPLTWWHSALSLAGWRLTTEEDRPRLSEHALCYFERHDWDWFSAVRV